MGKGGGTGVPTTSKELSVSENLRQALIAQAEQAETSKERRRSNMNEKQMWFLVLAALMVGVAHMIFAIWCTSGCPGL